jgi:hypothetical protein
VDHGGEDDLSDYRADFAGSGGYAVGGCAEAGWEALGGDNECRCVGACSWRLGDGLRMEGFKKDGGVVWRMVGDSKKTLSRREWQEREWGG